MSCLADVCWINESGYEMRIYAVPFDEVPQRGWRIDISEVEDEQIGYDELLHSSSGLEDLVVKEVRHHHVPSVKPKDPSKKAQKLEVWVYRPGSIVCDQCGNIVA